jgi:hypothetical protein
VTSVVRTKAEEAAAVQGRTWRWRRAAGAGHPVRRGALPKIAMRQTTKCHRVAPACWRTATWRWA